MIELPEAINLAKQLNESVSGKRVKSVLPPTKPHSFCWFNKSCADYGDKIAGRCVTGADGFGIYAELAFEGGLRLCVNDGVNLRLVSYDDRPANYQLMIVFDDGSSLAFTVAMYGGIILHDGSCADGYYVKSKNACSPFSSEFKAHFYSIAGESRPNLSMKAFLATEQRFPGIGNGTVQDILFNAGLHPKRKLGELDETELQRLLSCVTGTLGEMTELGGRDTEKDIFGVPGGYKTKMSKNTLTCGCPSCGGCITKQAYLGGSVYYCAACQAM